MSEPGTPPHRPAFGDPEWEPQGIERLALNTAQALATGGARLRTALLARPRLRAFLGSGRGLLLIALTAWTVTGATTLAVGQHLIVAVLYAATAALCTCITVLLTLVHASMGPRSQDRAS